MTDKELLKNLSRLGFPLMEVEKEFDVNQTLSEAVESHDTRLWEGFPVLLANAAKNKNFDYQRVERCLKKPEDKENLQRLTLLSLALYKKKKLKFSWANELQDYLLNQDKTRNGKRLNDFEEVLSKNNKFHVGGCWFSTERLYSFFDNYFEKEAVETGEPESKYERLSLEYALSQVFSPKQKELFFKKVNNEPMTKTEKEYYSRTVKRKVQALANSELHRLVQRLL